jgi:4-alpha-glucanotransferase
MSRRAGVLLHVSSLPGPFGIGNIGPAAREWLGWIRGAGFRVWQMLPLQVVDPNGCPYASPSSMAREPLFISPEDLVEDGWIRASELPEPVNTGTVDWAGLRASPRPWLEAACVRVASGVDLEPYLAAHPWLEDWATFAVLASQHGDAWWRWPERIRDRDVQALADVRDQHEVAWTQRVAAQWLFDQQWSRLRIEASRQEIELWGDLPFFVGHASCDVWANRSLFRLTPSGDVAVITGAPPDDFMPDGQRWDHPHYEVSAHHDEAYRWWRERVRALLAMTDTVRIDHFRGLVAAWEVDKRSDSAVDGRWVPGLGDPLLKAIMEEGQGHPMPFVAEDLGVITQEVEDLRLRYALPGMAVMQFGFSGGADHPYLSANHPEDRVAYIGTHDNPTLSGWWQALDPATKARACTLLGCGVDEVRGSMLRALWSSKALVSVVTAQDLLGLGPQARMNVPGVKRGNWSWRMDKEKRDLSIQEATRLLLLEMNR